MKRLVCLIMVCFFLFFLGCNATTTKDSTRFYYSRTNYAFGTESAVLTSENRDITGHEGDLQYLLSLYLVGPLNEELCSPFPASTKILSVEEKNTAVIIEISDCSKTLTESQFSLACACLTMTTFHLSGCEQVTIVSGDRSITLDQSAFLLYDSPISQETINTEDLS